MVPLPAPREVRRLFMTLGEHHTMGLVTFESEIPSDHPEKEKIESSIREAFAQADGSWRVGILLVRDAPWWIVFVHDAERGFRRSALLDSPWKQRPEFIGSVVKELMRERRRARRPAKGR